MGILKKTSNNKYSTSARKKALLGVRAAFGSHAPPGIATGARAGTRRRNRGAVIYGGPMTYSTHLLRHLRFTIGQNIHRLRAKQKIPLRKFARLTGISERLLDHYELGKNEIGLDDMLKIACALGVEVKQLLE